MSQSHMIGAKQLVVLQGHQNGVNTPPILEVKLYSWITPINLRRFGKKHMDGARLQK